MNAISTAEYRELLRDALPSAADTGTEGTSRSTLFTPNSHRNALEPDVTIVKGARGAGKTYWFQSLLNQELRELAAEEYRLPRLRQIDPLIGFSEAAQGSVFPTPRILRGFVERDIEPVDIWLTVCLKGLGMPELVNQNDWSTRVEWLRAHPEAVDQALEAADREAEANRNTKLLLFDALEHLHRDRVTADKLVGGILELALQLRLSTRNLRAKVFIRHDMLASAPSNFRDYSKLTSNAADLTWTEQDLYGLLFQHLGNAASVAAERFRQYTRDWKSAEDRFVPPRDLIDDADRQSKIFTEIAGPYMGNNHRKGYTYSWLPNHLADGKGQTSPRTFLVALRHAAEQTAGGYGGHQYALHWDAIRRGVQHASQVRVDQVREDQPWVAKVFEPLHGSQVPIEQDTVIDEWRSHGLLEELVPGSADEGGPTGPAAGTYLELVDELIELGMMTRRRDGRLDLPDVYRIAFSLGRKGGVPRVQQR